MAAAAPEIAVVAKLREAPAIAGGRVNPVTNTPGGEIPCAVVTRQGNTSAPRLSGKRAALTAATIEVACFAATQAAAIALAKDVRDRLAPTGSPWRDPTNGVQGCFYQDSNEEVIPDPAQDTPRVVRETYLVWHYPT